MTNNFSSHVFQRTVHFVKVLLTNGSVLLCYQRLFSNQHFTRSRLESGLVSRLAFHSDKILF